MKNYRYLDLITALFAVVLIISNLASAKIVELTGWLTFDGGTLMFPLAYILGDVLTEVYGYERSRRVIWIGFFTLILYCLSVTVVGLLPSPQESAEQGAAWNIALGSAPRIVLASIVAYFSGEFVNAYLVAKLKVITAGRHLWARFLGSTVVGQIFDTLLFLFIAFWGVMDLRLWLTLAVSNYVFKLAVEVLMLPGTYAVVGALKKAEGIDHFDVDTNFSPFRFRADRA